MANDAGLWGLAMSAAPRQRPRAEPATEDEIAEAQAQLEAVRELRRGFDLAIRLFEQGDEQSRQASFALADKLWPASARSLEMEEVAERIKGMSSWDAFNEIMQAAAHGELALDEAEELTKELKP